MLAFIVTIGVVRGRRIVRASIGLPAWTRAQLWAIGVRRSARA